MGISFNRRMDRNRRFHVRVAPEDIAELAACIRSEERERIAHGPPSMGID
jgi:hypothetical protein